MPALSSKEQEYAKAARLRFVEGMEHSQIAEHFGYKPQTVRKWFSEGKIDGLKRKFSDQEKFKLQRAMEQDIWDAEQTAKDLLADAQKYAETASQMRQIAESHMKVRKQKIDLLQEMGIIKKPKERKEVTENKTGDSLEQLREINEQVKELEADQ